ncbi:HPr family phosphocarrier protein [Deinococcus roseus]|uniref:HPr family phosphocarrier protein n=1 Tax=Deinococcus roseus TaxID=392414 RepID=UPI00166D2202|nr:HPr family phosphocarrier protein [Deinococcus roseus]
MTDPAGIHARPAAQLSIALTRIGAQVKLQHGSRMADARSVIQLLSLGATAGSELQAEINGTPEQTEAVIRELQQFL